MRIVVKRIPIEIIELGIETYAQIDIEEILFTSYPPITKTVLKFYTEYTVFEFQKEYSVKIKNDDMVIKCYIGGLSNILIQKDAGERTSVKWYKVICDSEVHDENNPLTCYINPHYPETKLDKAIKESMNHRNLIQYSKLTLMNFLNDIPEGNWRISHMKLSIIWRNQMNIKRIKCILTGGCKFKSSDTESKCNDKEKTCTITETCYKCGKKYTAVFTYKQLGVPD